MKRNRQMTTCFPEFFFCSRIIHIVTWHFRHKICLPSNWFKSIKGLQDCPPCVGYALFCMFPSKTGAVLEILQILQKVELLSKMCYSRGRESTANQELHLWKAMKKGGLSQPAQKLWPRKMELQLQVRFTSNTRQSGEKGEKLKQRGSSAPRSSEQR